ncbi:Rv2253 family sensor-like surface protein [Mycobacterium sp. ML4]
MSGSFTSAVAALTAVGVPLCLAPAAHAGEVASWNGEYLVVLGANAKSGTSVAAAQPEFAHRSTVSFSSSCTAGVCVASVDNPAPPKNESMPRTIEFTWNGSQWVREMTWKWDCLLPDGTIEYDPAKSITVYTPGQYGILTGVFHTDIASGTCAGNVDMPVSAKPVSGPVT